MDVVGGLQWWRSERWSINAASIAARQIRLCSIMRTQPNSAGVIPKELWPCDSPDNVNCNGTCNEGYQRIMKLRKLRLSKWIFGEFESHGDREFSWHLASRMGG